MIPHITFSQKMMRKYSLTINSDWLRNREEDREQAPGSGSAGGAQSPLQSQSNSLCGGGALVAQSLGPCAERSQFKPRWKTEN